MSPKRLVCLSIVFIAARLAFAQAPGDAELNSAYSALSKKDYDTAIESFEAGLKHQTQNAGAHKDLAYTLLKTGDNAAARDEFKKALSLNPGDDTAALEYAFLCYDTKLPIEARRTFDRLRHRAKSSTRETAEQAFQNIDGKLADGIARWKQALANSANPLDISSYSAHWELAQLAEQRDDLPLAAEQYEICRRLKPELSPVLLDLSRVWQQLNRVDEARAARLAASRASDSRTAELALVDLEPRYPYPYEFLGAIEIDPRNLALRHELGYLYLAMNKQSEAMAQFEKILEIDPKDQMANAQLATLRGLSSRSDARTGQPGAGPVDAKSMGQKSLALGYVKDAIKYLRQAHEQNPSDARTTLQLGWAYNAAKDDQEALRYFDEVRHSSDAFVAAEADRAYRNLQGGGGPPLLTMWALPMFSTRWHDAFTYGQVKRVIPLPWLKGQNLFSLYLSTRFIGDARSALPGQNGVSPQYLSESSFIFGAGISTHVWHHLTAWAEAGEAVKYLPSRTDIGAAIPDYRGGLNYAKGFGNLLGAKRSGFFYETTADAIWISRFDKDWLFYSQHRAGRTFKVWGNTYAQALFDLNFTKDSKNQYWANTAEAGPGLRLHLPWMPPNVYFAADLLRGMYTNAARPNYNDVRLSLWYAASK